MHASRRIDLTSRCHQSFPSPIEQGPTTRIPREQQWAFIGPLPVVDLTVPAPGSADLAWRCRAILLERGPPRDDTHAAFGFGEALFRLARAFYKDAQLELPNSNRET